MAQAQDLTYQQCLISVGHPDSKSYVDSNAFHVRYSTTDGANKTIVPKSLHGVSCTWHIIWLRLSTLYNTEGGPKWDRNTTRITWPGISTPRWRTANTMPKTAVVRQQRHLPLFPLIVPLELIAVGILGPLSQTEGEKQYVFIITDRNSKLTRAILTTKTSTSYVPTIIFDDWIIPYNIPSFLLIDNGPQFVA